jgi:hypothetical protein
VRISRLDFIACSIPLPFEFLPALLSRWCTADILRVILQLVSPGPTRNVVRQRQFLDAYHESSK